MIGNGGGLFEKNGLKGRGGYIGMGAEGRLSSISVRFSDLFVPSLLSNRQLASRLDVWFWVSPALGSDVPLGNHFDWGYYVLFSVQ